MMADQYSAAFKYEPPASPRTGETPEQILDRLAKELGCEPRQVCDKVIAMLEERRKG